MRLNELIIEK